MTIGQSFQEEVRVGSYVEVSAGNKDITGIVVSVGDDMVKIRKEDNRISTIRLDVHPA